MSNTFCPSFGAIWRLVFPVTPLQKLLLNNNALLLIWCFVSFLQTIEYCMQFINSVPDHQQYLNDLILGFAAHCYTYKIIMMSLNSCSKRCTVKLPREVTLYSHAGKWSIEIEKLISILATFIV